MLSVRIACLHRAVGLVVSRSLRTVRGPSRPSALLGEEALAEVVGGFESEAKVVDEVWSETERYLPKNLDDYQQGLKSPINQPPNPLFLNVAVIGMPNAGKSTLMNQLVGAKISAVSKKVHTTRRNVIGTLVHESTQVVFSDSPGLVTQSHCMKHNLEHTFMTQPKQSVSRCDVIMAVVDASNPRERKSLNAGVIEKLKQFADKPSILVLNKVDCINKKRKLFDVSYQLTDGKVAGQQEADPRPHTVSLPVDRKGEAAQLKVVEKRMRSKGYILELPKIDGDNEELADDSDDEAEALCSWSNFSRVFMISALLGDGIDDLRKYLLSLAKPGDWKFPAHVITTQNPETLVLTTVREKLLDRLLHELPYVVRMKITSWCVMRTGTLCVSIDLLVPQQRYIPQVLGEEGKIIADIANESRQEISNAFRCDVSLKLVVKCTEIRK